MTPFYTVESLGPSQKLTPEGFLVIHNVPLARTGPQLYSEREVPVKGDSSGRVIIYRDEDEVFRPETIASLQGKPIAVEHPDEDIIPTNYKELSVGHVINPRRGEGALNNLLLADLMITCPDAIKAVRNKELREVSVGYEADYEDSGGGRGRQRNILANHLALVRDGRCGPICRIGDSAFNEAEHPRGEGGKFTAGEGAKPRTSAEHAAQSDWHETEADRHERSAKQWEAKGRRGLASEARTKAETHRSLAEHHLNWSEARTKDQLHNYADEGEPGVTSPLVTKAAADYTDLSPDDHERCGWCDHWLGKGGCEKVIGEISEDGWCKLFFASSTADEATVDWSMIEEAGRHLLKPKRSKHFHLHLS